MGGGSDSIFVRPAVFPRPWTRPHPQWSPRPEATAGLDGKRATATAVGSAPPGSGGACERGSQLAVLPRSRYAKDATPGRRRACPRSRTMGDVTSVNTGRFMSAIARWCFRHRFAVIAAWVLVLVGLGALSQAVKSDYNNSFSLPGTGSTTAQQLLAKAVPARAGDSDTIVWQVSHGTVRDQAVTARMSGAQADRHDARGRRRGQPVRAARGRADQPGRPHRLRHGELHQAGQQPGPGGHHPGHQRGRGGPRARAQRPARRAGHRAAPSSRRSGVSVDDRRARGRGGAVHRVRLAAGDAAADCHRHRRGRRRADGDRAADPRDRASSTSRRSWAR